MNWNILQRDSDIGMQPRHMGGAGHGIDYDDENLRSQILIFETGWPFPLEELMQHNLPPSYVTLYQTKKVNFLK